MSTAVEAHEAELARSIGAEHAISFGHARQALVAIMQAAELEPQSTVILSPLTCKVVPLALASLGLKLCYADIERSTLNLSAARAATEQDGRALLFQHTYGSATGLKAAELLASERDWLLIEDCAQCMPTRAGAPSVGRHAQSGALRAAIFSNNLMKPLPAGSGGVAVTNDPQLAAAIQHARGSLQAPNIRFGASIVIQSLLHTCLLRPSTYWPLFALARRFGSHYEMLSLEDEVQREVRDAPGKISSRQARRGTRWLRRASALAEHRRNTCAAYAEALQGAPALEFADTDADAPLCYFPIQIDDKPGLLRRAEAARVEVVPWPVSTPIYPVENERELATYGYELGSCPVAEGVAQRLVGLPTHARVGGRARDAVVELVLAHVQGR